MYNGERFSLAIVDNDQLTLKMLTVLIRRKLPNADLTWVCRTGRDAVTRCLSADSQLDVLLVDMSLEGLSGVEVCRQIRAATADVVLIGVTSFSLEHYAADALAAVGRYGRSRWWCLMPPAIAAVRWVVAARAGIPFGDYAILLVSFFVVYMFGRAMSWRATAVQAEQDRLRYERERDRVEAMRRDARAASRIHDAVTNDLAYVAMRLDYERSRSGNDEQHAALFDDLYQRTIDTLGEVRTVINMLDGNGDGSDSESVRDHVGNGHGDGVVFRRSDANIGNSEVDASGIGVIDNMATTSSSCTAFPECVRDVLEHGDQYLAQLGFTGDSTLIDNSTADEPADMDNVTRERGSAVIDMLRELYTNIAVHGDLSGEYRVVVHRNRDGLSVDQVNDIAAQSLLPDKPHSGKGLSLHRSRFAALGGSISASAEDGTWILHATLPSDSSQQ
ncbi:response regulator [Bifidobacterium olomucense]|uniref:DNA-binding response regulator n=1 Tax=Bifidobacterium olomucense TaxID=2675324 RepID=A0A7Y0EX05_9BIFI|nr:response regulator [Bifidobacterium sp. DSM 109959]NMM97929.1 DNA-binding response regulator [Bifidobacterium sp. DSM 109959]